MKRLNCAMSVECLGHFSGIVPSLTFILTKQHGVRCGKYLLKTSGNAILGLKISKCSQMPWSSRNCAFSASTKATYYSLWACCLKTFDSPECPFFLFSLMANYYCTNIFMLTSQVSNITKYFDFWCKNSYTVEPRTSPINRTLSHVWKLTSYISLYNKPLLSERELLK